MPSHVIKLRRVIGNNEEQQTDAEWMRPNLPYDIQASRRVRVGVWVTGCGTAIITVYVQLQDAVGGYRRLS